ncbi:NAD(P)H-dependent oxidoreductase [Aeromicrobium sp. YIM 150415]|uniref:FMN-dependent NADH-azoreductase n=1 Tax=Aeromicrobium sp. YIM 150415 TaxID=2803912 RepID=UPI0019625720|nr:NAD(P)H-dependent oxidoreductase [Aeromicrobium sp. YIM 150415]MBM9464390.1 NAD(P)H-dependent oxidoreductase [Aeromicrobium sp. YIM 150415]
MSLFRLDASIRTEGSASRALADIVEKHWREASSAAPISRRHLVTDPIPSDAWHTAVTSWHIPEADRTAAQQAAVGLASSLADELADADAYLFAVPLYNFGVSQHFKTYVDLVSTDPRMADAEPATAGKPGVLVTVQGGNYSPGTPKEGWDHATSWMRRILEDVWHIDLDVVTREFTLVGENPALDEFADMAADIRAGAESKAHESGQIFAQRSQPASA